MCRSLGWGISRCCRAGREGHTDPRAGPRRPRVPPRVAPSCDVLVPEDRRAGAAALSFWLGRARPASPRPGGWHVPPKTVGARPSSALGPNNSRPPICPKLNLLADRGGSVSEGPAHPGGGTLTRSPPHQQPETTTPGWCPQAPRFRPYRGHPRRAPTPLPRRATPPPPHLGGPQ